jgi:hypothetical protein
MTPQVSGSVEVAAPMRGGDRRSGRRGRVLLGGKVVYGEGFSTDCTIRDLTETGARLTLPEHGAPKDFYLIVVRDGIAYRSRTLWTKGREAGVAFETSYDLAGDVPAAIRPTRHLWAALSPRTF